MYKGEIMTIYSTKNKPKRTAEHNSGELKVETAGYRTGTQQINALIDAGARLIDQRKNPQMYDFIEGEKPYDKRIPDRSPNFDLVDAHDILTETSQNLENQKKASEEKKAESARLVEEENKKNAEFVQKHRDSIESP
uniref:hypothetical protein n=1 Tax=Candidatus Electrothrix sp. TaxID=2170559 RepID=UPI0040576EE8